MKNSDISRTLMAATARILRPLVKILIRHGMSYAAFTELSKKIYYEVAKTEFAIPGKKQTSSRISTLTGLSRKEVARLETLPEENSALDTTRINRAARVISGWVRDPKFHNERGEPADLAFDGKSNSFTQLVKQYSGDITARTIADELVRVDSIAITTGGLIHLKTRAYVANDDALAKLTILGTDVSDLITTIDHNLSTTNQPLFQRKVAYNYIPDEAAQYLKLKLVDIAQFALENIDKELAAESISNSDKPSNQHYKRIGVGIYYFEGDQA